MQNSPVTYTATASLQHCSDSESDITNTLARLGSGTNFVAVTLLKWFKD